MMFEKEGFRVFHGVGLNNTRQWLTVGHKPSFYCRKETKDNGGNGTGVSSPVSDGGI
jgi:hypothetical protein